MGLKAIKGKGAAAFEQDPTTAKFDDMPRNAIDAALTNVIALAEAGG